MDDGSNDVTGDEYPKNYLRRERRILPANTIDHDADDGIDGGGEKDWGNNDEEVLNNEIDDGVRVDLRREDAENIADDLHGGAKCRGGEVPCAVLKEEEQVGEEGDGEENHA